VQSAEVASWASLVNTEATSERPSHHEVSRQLQPNKNVWSPPWYRSCGYGSSEEDMASSVVAPSDASSKQVKPRKPPPCKSSSNEFLAGLRASNIVDKQVVDDDKPWLEKVIASTTDVPVNAEEERNWNKDMSKCRVSDEPIFQRTVMMELINRHELAATLDYTCESRWTCERLPHRGSDFALRMPMPRPDLAVAFKATSILDEFQQCDLGNMIKVMCPEAYKEEKCDRAFHFLAIEVKGALGHITDWEAHRQNFNTASQALHNIYFFMEKAGPEDLDAFFSKVRFYSVVATTSTFYIRVHRAIKLEQSRIREDYPLGFVYDVIHHHDGPGYTRAKATRIIRNILVEYGIKVLHPLLKGTMGRVWDSLQPPKQRQDRVEEAERQRSRDREMSRQDRETRAPRKKQSTIDPDASFTRKELGGLTVASSTSSTDDD
jgi:hypothetical protein